MVVMVANLYLIVLPMDGSQGIRAFHSQGIPSLLLISYHFIPSELLISSNTYFFLLLCQLMSKVVRKVAAKMLSDLYMLS